MEYLHTASLLSIIICSFSAFAFGQVTVTGPEGGAVEEGQKAVLTCVPDSGSSSFYVWNDQTGTETVQIIASGGTINDDVKYSNFESLSPEELTINSATVDDEGLYDCTVQGGNSPDFSLSVEVGSTLTMAFSTDPLIAGTDFTATCYVNGSRPQLDIAWTLNDITLGVDPVVTNPTNADPDLSDTNSTVTLTATPAMNGQNLKCTTSVHVVTSLKREETTQLNVTYPPTSETATIVVDATKEGDTQLRVTCQVSAAVDGIDPANPAINMYTFYAGSDEIHSSTTDPSVVVDIPDNDTDYMCSAGNDLGTIESEAVNYDPGRGLSTAAIVGTVIGVLLFIALVVVLVVIFVLKPDCVSGKGSGPPPKTMTLQEQKPTNGNSEVEKTPLNEVVTEKVAPPTAAPRQSTVPHRNDNPGGAVYAEVQKGGRGYDQPDHTHPPQRSNLGGATNTGYQADSGMNYATLDLSEEAGHTERQVPQNKDNVVVYSSILV